MHINFTLLHSFASNLHFILHASSNRLENWYSCKSQIQYHIFIIWRQTESVFLGAALSNVSFFAKNLVQTEWRKCQAVTSTVKLMQKLAIIVPLGYAGLYVTVSSRHVRRYWFIISQSEKKLYFRPILALADSNFLSFPLIANVICQTFRSSRMSSWKNTKWNTSFFRA